MLLKVATLVGVTCLVPKKKKQKLRGCYRVTDRVFALPFPTERKRAIEKVKEILKVKHRGHYKMYNLCMEQDYDPSHFDDLVERFPFDDNHVPSFPMIMEFCGSVYSWLSRHPKNIAVIYCMTGKYQTNLMVSSYLVLNGFLAYEGPPPKLYADKRIKNKLGEMVPSQQRYIDYWQKYLYGCLPEVNLTVTEPCTREFRRIRLYDTSKDIESIFFIVSELQEVHGKRYRPSAETCRNFCRKFEKRVFENHHQYDYPFMEEEDEDDEHNRLDCYFLNTVQVTGDVSVTFYEKNTGGRLFYACFNTAFIENDSIKLSISELDKVGHKGKSIAGEEFYVELLFGPENPKEDVAK